MSIVKNCKNGVCNIMPGPRPAKRRPLSSRPPSKQAGAFKKHIQSVPGPFVIPNPRRRPLIGPFKDDINLRATSMEALDTCLLSPIKPNRYVAPVTNPKDRGVRTTGRDSCHQNQQGSNGYKKTSGDAIKPRYHDKKNRLWFKRKSMKAKTSQSIEKYLTRMKEANDMHSKHIHKTTKYKRYSLGKKYKDRGIWARPNV